MSDREAGRLRLAIIDHDESPGLEVDLPALDPVVNIAFEDNLGPILEGDIYVPIPIRPGHTGEFGLAGRERVIDRIAALTKVHNFPKTADTVEAGVSSTNEAIRSFSSVTIQTSAAGGSSDCLSVFDESAVHVL